MIKDFSTGKLKINDHQGNPLTKTGTCFDAIARQAVDEKTVIKQQIKLNRRKARQEATQNQSEQKQEIIKFNAYDYTVDQQGEMMQDYLKARNQITQGKQIDQTQNVDSMSPLKYVLQLDFSILNKDQINTDQSFRETITKKIDSLAPDLQQLVSRILQFNKITNEKKRSQLLFLVAKKYHQKLKEIRYQLFGAESALLNFTSQPIHMNSRNQKAKENVSYVEDTNSYVSQSFLNKTFESKFSRGETSQISLNTQTQWMNIGDGEGQEFQEQGGLLKSMSQFVLQRQRNLRTQKTNLNITQQQFKKQTTEQNALLDKSTYGNSTIDHQFEERFEQFSLTDSQSNLNQTLVEFQNKMDALQRIEIQKQKTKAEQFDQVKLKILQNARREKRNILKDENNLLNKLLQTQLKEQLQEKRSISTLKQKTLLTPIMENFTNQQQEIPVFNQETVLVLPKAHYQKQEKLTGTLVKNLKKENEHQIMVKKAVQDLQKNNKKPITEPSEDYHEVNDEISDLMSQFKIQNKEFDKKQQQKTNEALFVFVKECEKRNIPILQLMKQLKNKNLEIMNFKIDKGLQAALMNFLQVASVGGVAVNSVTFIKNDLKDEQLSFLFSAFSGEKNKVKSIVSIQNQIGVETLKTIEQVLKPFVDLEQQVKTNNLQELNINETKFIQKQGLIYLLDIITENCQMSLKKFGFSGQQFDDEVADKFQKFIMSSRQIQKLDISNMKLTNLKYFTETLTIIGKENTTIRNLNIAGVGFQGQSLISKDQSDYILSVAQLSKQLPKLQHLNLSFCFPGLQVKKTVTPEQPCFISELFKGIRSSKTLLAVHYSGNSINQQTLLTISEILNMLKADQAAAGGYLTLDHQQNRNKADQMFGDFQNDTDQRSLNQMIKEHDNKMKQLDSRKSFKSVKKSNQKQEKTSGKEVYGYLGNNEEFSRLDQTTEKSDLRTQFITENEQKENTTFKSITSLDETQAENSVSTDDRYIFQRILGYKEIQYAHKWCLRDKCWVCQGWRYTLFIWSPYLACSGDLYQIRDVYWLERWQNQLLTTNKLQKIIEIFEINPKEQNNEDSEIIYPSLPRIFGPATNFKYKEMIPLPLFLEKIAQNNRAWLRIYEENQQQPMEAKLIGCNETTVIKSNKEWPSFFKQYLQHADKQSYLSISKLLKIGFEKNERFYCYADFYPPRPKQIILAVQIPGISKVNLISQKFGIRKLAPPTLMKCVKKKRLSRKFNLQSSIYKSWKVDLQAHYRKCFLADMKYSKIKKFVKDPKDYNDICEAILENYESIFEQYLYGQGISKYPTVGMIHFTNICQQWKCIDKKSLAVSDIDRLFFAVNFEEGADADELDDNPDNELCRYEFFELIVRMAKLKYENMKLGLSVANSFRKFLEDHIKQNNLVQYWHKMRQREVWTLEVHDLLEYNQKDINAFLNWWIKTYSSKQGRKFINLEDIHDMFKTHPCVKGQPKVLGPLNFKQEIKFTDVNTTLCFGNSKFILSDEMAFADHLTRLKEDEFYEFIVRIADLANFNDNTQQTYVEEKKEIADLNNDDDVEKEPDDDLVQNTNQQMLMEDKVLLILDLLFRLCRDTSLNLKARRPQVQGLGDSESDYD